MGKRHHLTDTNRSKTLPSSPTHSSSSSSEFEFAVSPRKSCPADELFYKGQLLPLHIPPRISMVRSLLLSSSSTARDSNGSSSSGDSFSSDLSFLAAGIDSARRSTTADEDSSSGDLLIRQKSTPASNSTYFSLSRFSNVFKKDNPNSVPDQSGSKPVNRLSAKEVIRKYLRKMKPFYQKLSQQKQQSSTKTTSLWVGVEHEITAPSNLSYMRKSTRRSYVASCPSSIGSSPTRSFSRSGLSVRGGSSATTSSGSYSYSDHSTMEELQSAIQGAIAHCKNSLR